MKKRLLSILPMLVAGQLWAQAPIETFSFDNGSFNGANGATPTNSSVGITTIEDVDNNSNSALFLNGTQNITYSGLSLNPYDGLSVSFWVKPSASMTQNKGYAVFSQRTQCKAVHSIESFVNGSTKKLSFTLRRTNGAVSVNVDYTPDVWQHFTFTFNHSDGKMRVYKDGEFVATGSNSVEKGNIPQSISGNFVIGSNPCVGTDGTLQYIGGLDELKIYDEKLSELDVNLLWDPTTDVRAYQNNVVETSLVEEYDFTNFVADYGNERGYIQDANSNDASALELDGDNTKSYSSPTSTTSGYTVSLWLKPDAFAAGGRSRIITSQRSACTGVSSFEIYQGETEISFVTRTSAGGAAVRVPYTAGEWAKFTFVADQATNTLLGYKNGAFDNQATGSGRIPSNLSTGTLRLGTSVCVASDGTPKYTGGIDELYVYQDNLTAQEITDAYAQSDDDQFSPVFYNKFDVAGFLTKEVRLDPATNIEEDAISLEGAGGINLEANTIATNGDGYAFSYWIKPDGSNTASNQLIFGKRDQCTFRDLFAANLNAVTQKVSMEFRTLDQETAVLALDYTPDVWQQVTFSVDLNESYIYGYINGEKKDSVAITGHEVPASYSANVTLQMASSPCEHTKYTGGLDNIKIYSAPLQKRDVLRLFDGSTITSTLDATEQAEELVVYPSPASTHIFVTAGDVQILDLNGRVLIDTVSEGRVDVSALQAGLYIVRQGTQKAKLIIE